MVSTAQPYLVWNWILTNTANSNNNRNLVKMMDGESITFNHKCFPYANSKTPTKKKDKIVEDMHMSLLISQQHG